MLRLFVIISIPVITAFLVAGLRTGMFDDFAFEEFFRTKGQQIVITIEEDGFHPRSIELEKGDTIVFINNDSQDHWPASNLHPTHTMYAAFDPQKPLKSGESWSFIFEQEGTWFFHDHLYPKNGGKITVLSPKVGSTQNNKKMDEKSLETEGRRLMSVIEQEQDEREKLRLVKELTYAVGPTKAMALFNNYQPQRTGQTHLLTHGIGEVTYALYGEEALPYCANDMLNGCVHGLMLTAISDIGFEGIQRMVEHCKIESLFKYRMCLHASGHAFLAFTNYDDIFSPLKNCDLLNENPNDVLHCYNGVFMENVHGDHEGRIPPLHPWLDTTDLLFPCNTVEPQYQSACYLNQAGWWYHVFQQNIEKVVAYCMEIPTDYLPECVNNLGRVISSVVKNDISGIKKYCHLLPNELASDCISVIALSTFAIGDESLPFILCSEIESSEAAANCYSGLENFFQENNLSGKKYQELCLKFEPQYQYLCHNEV